ncbi:hypothetical protein B0H14DRAFT_2785033, partial [Mycena olivaceomarginata]
MPLPSDFTSLYRLFLRTSSASVLHQNKSTKTLLRRNEVEIWLQTWHLRIDNTLALLYTSCKTCGLSHRLTRNLG